MIEQLNLFENGEFILGINLLNELKWKQGLQVLKKAKPVENKDKLFLKKATEAGAYWEAKLTAFEQNEDAQEAINELLHCYKNYDFPDRLNAAKQKLLQYMAEWMINKDSLDNDTSVQIFSLLKEEGKYLLAEKLMKACLQKHPKAFENYYLLAQTEWLNGHSAESKKHYLQAFLYYPDRSMMRYVEFKELKALAEKHSLYMIPAYAWLKGLARFVTINDQFQSFDKKHNAALRAYKLLKKCHTTLKAKKDPLPYRKKLKQVAPELLVDYLNNYE